MKRLLMVRHAECKMNLEIGNKIGGQTNDSPLTARGEQQAALLGQYLAASGVTFDRVWTSTAVRARGTAAIMLAAMQRPDVIPIASEDLLELNQGKWTGKLRSECYTEENLALIRASQGTFAPPGGESQRDVEERMVAFIEQQVLPQLTEGGPPGLLVGHGVAMKCFLRYVLDSNPAHTHKMHMDNTCVSEVAWHPRRSDSHGMGDWELVRLNDSAHLRLQAAQQAAMQLQATAAAVVAPAAHQGGLLPN